MILRPFRLFSAIAGLAASGLLAVASFVQSQEPAKSPPTTDRALSPVVSPAQSELQPGKRWALLVGINNYEHVNKLQYCGRDVDVLRKALVEHGGYLPEHVHVLSDTATGSRNPTKGNILIEFTTFLKQVRPEDTVLFCFCGHGKLAEEGPNKNKSYLVPIDGNEELLEDTAISVERLHKIFDNCDARQKIVILDACHAAGVGDARADSKGFDPQDAKPGKGTIELLACNAQQKSKEPKELEQGLFSYYLAKAIEGAADLRPVGNEDGLITFDEAYNFVYREVMSYSHNQQSPVVRRGQVEGELTLAVRAGKSQGTLLEDRLLLSTLNERAARGRASPELKASLTQWLAADETTSWGRDIRLLASLLARDLITEPEFMQLTRTYRPQLSSHTTAVESWKNRSIRLLAIGVNIYSDEDAISKLLGPKYDVELFADIIKTHGGSAAPEVVVLLDKQATIKAVSEAIARLAESSKPGDLLMITFAGHGVTGSKDETGRIVQTGGWLMYDADIKAAFKRLGQNDKSLETVHGLLTPQSIVNLLADTPADVLIVSDAFSLMNDWPALGDRSGPRNDIKKLGSRDPNRIAALPTSSKVTASRLWIGTSTALEAVFEDQKVTHGFLTFLVSQSLLGQADKESPCTFSKAGTGKLSALPNEVPDAIQIQGKPDGFVSLHELAATLVAKAAAEDRHSIILRGHLHKTDCVLTRSTLTVE